MCSFKLHFWLNRLPHISQRYGLSPVWILLCLSRCPTRSKHLPQYGHMKRFLNNNLFTVLIRTALYKLRYWPKPSSPRPNTPCWSPAELLQGAANLVSREDWGRQYKELFPPVWVCGAGPHWVLSLSYKIGGSGCSLASSFSSSGSHFTCISGWGRPFWSLSARALFSKVPSSATPFRSSVNRQQASQLLNSLTDDWYSPLFTCTAIGQYWLDKVSIPSMTLPCKQRLIFTLIRMRSFSE